MAKDSIDDFLAQMNGGGNNTSTTNNDMPIIKTKPVNEGQMPEIKTKMELFSFIELLPLNDDKNTNE